MFDIKKWYKQLQYNNNQFNEQLNHNCTILFLNILIKIDEHGKFDDHAQKISFRIEILKIIPIKRNRILQR